MEDTVEEVVTAPGQLVRITSVARRVLQEMQVVELDDAARVRVLLLLRRCLADLDQCLDASLRDELHHLDLRSGQYL